MPTYDYRCNNCGHEFELFQPMSEGVKKKCPACAKMTLERLIGAGAALIFKGSGFYETDYRSKDYQKAKESESKNGTESKPDEKKSRESKSDDSSTKTSEDTKPPKKTEAKKDTKPKADSSSGKTSGGD